MAVIIPFYSLCLRTSYSSLAIVRRGITNQVNRKSLEKRIDDLRFATFFLHSFD